jgi:mannose-6-phosphate isomerase-like protein (cupin superfamily)
MDNGVDRSRILGHLGRNRSTWLTTRDQEDPVPVISAPTAPTHHAGATRFTSLATPSRGCTRTSVWQIELPPGETPVPHLLTDEEVFVVLAGTARVELDGVISTASVGDSIVVPPDVPFALGNDGTEDLRLLCCLPVGGQARFPDGEPFTPPWAL